MQNNNSNVQSKDYVANYELNRYKYSDFWKDRSYEHRAEEMLLKKLFSRYFSDMSKRNIVDVGGAFGRLTYLYGERVASIILMDYSTHELRDGMAYTASLPYHEKITYLAANAYRLPFKTGVVDYVLCVRVMHHLKDPVDFFAELSRSLSFGGTAIIEFAHKNHILARIRNLLKGNREFFKESILSVSHNNKTSQGISGKTQQVIMYNFSLEYIKDAAKKVGLTVLGDYSCSFFRHKVCKKYLPEKFLLSLESIAQKLFSWAHLTPSIFVVLRKNSGEPKSSATDLYQCPTCGNAITKRGETYVCVNHHTFPQSDQNILDLRDPRPETVTF